MRHRLDKDQQWISGLMLNLEQSRGSHRDCGDRARKFYRRLKQRLEMYIANNIIIYSIKGKSRRGIMKCVGAGS